MCYSPPPFIHIHSLNRYSLSSCSVSCTLLCENTQQERSPCSVQFTCSRRAQRVPGGGRASGRGPDEAPATVSLTGARPRGMWLQGSGRGSEGRRVLLRNQRKPCGRTCAGRGSAGWGSGDRGHTGQPLGATVRSGDRLPWSWKVRVVRGNGGRTWLCQCIMAFGWNCARSICHLELLY